MPPSRVLFADERALSRRTSQSSQLSRDEYQTEHETRDRCCIHASENESVRGASQPACLSSRGPAAAFGARRASSAPRLRCKRMRRRSSPYACQERSAHSPRVFPEVELVSWPTGVCTLCSAGEIDPRCGVRRAACPVAAGQIASSPGLDIDWCWSHISCSSPSQQRWRYSLTDNHSGFWLSPASAPSCTPLCCFVQEHLTRAPRRGGSKDPRVHGPGRSIQQLSHAVDQ
jgi:hypothetical protein